MLVAGCNVIFVLSYCVLNAGQNLIDYSTSWAENLILVNIEFVIPPVMYSYSIRILRFSCVSLYFSCENRLL
ncbi:hypothetical protein BDF20DRAFT_894960 [Mycotypha africana]|uniref:uncharacterized protein n=1 Tax=Mycotypha africana TaxID=64632 RepID=UPI0023004908|nr:uncharacterized protein BDF20DRAFT_894960 [Mycotypha africana]KAI8968202.1 hypothetical protein BDF20DRAFT_894960 [Mycotypha africana]